MTKITTVRIDDEPGGVQTSLVTSSRMTTRRLRPHKGESGGRKPVIGDLTGSPSGYKYSPRPVVPFCPIVTRTTRLVAS